MHSHSHARSRLGPSHPFPVSKSLLASSRGLLRGGFVMRVGTIFACHQGTEQFGDISQHLFIYNTFWLTAQ